MIDDHRLTDVRERAGLRMYALDEDVALAQVHVVEQWRRGLVAGADRQVVLHGERHPFGLAARREDLLQLTPQGMVGVTEVDWSVEVGAFGEIGPADGDAERFPRTARRR